MSAADEHIQDALDSIAQGYDEDDERRCYDTEGNPAPPWGCGELFGVDAFGDPMKCEWGNLCEDCEPSRPNQLSEEGAPKK